MTRESKKNVHTLLNQVISSQTWVVMTSCHLVKYRAGIVKKTPCWYVRSWTCAHSYHFQVWRVKYSLALIQDFLKCRLGTRYVLLQLKHAASLEVLSFTKREPAQNHWAGFFRSRLNFSVKDWILACVRMIGLCSFLQVARDTRLLHQKVGGGIRSWKVPQEKNCICSRCHE